MSLVRAFTNRGKKADAHVPLPMGRAASHRNGKPVVRTQISSPVALVSTVPLGSSSARWTCLGLTAVLVILEAVRLTLSDIFAAVGRIGWSVLMTHSTRAIGVAVLLGTVALGGVHHSITEYLVLHVMVALLLLLVVRSCVLAQPVRPIDEPAPRVAGRPRLAGPLSFAAPVDCET